MTFKQTGESTAEAEVQVGSVEGTGVLVDQGGRGGEGDSGRTYRPLLTIFRDDFAFMHVENVRHALSSVLLSLLPGLPPRADQGVRLVPGGRGESCGKQDKEDGVGIHQDALPARVALEGRNRGHTSGLSVWEKIGWSGVILPPCKDFCCLGGMVPCTSSVHL